MNKRPLMAGGLPAKPYVPPTAPAPPLPAGPPPQQPAYSNPQQHDAAAHAAAWAAYYQSQGLTATGQPQTNTGYNAIQPQQPAAAGATGNPYANYGYGGQAATQHLTGGPPVQHQQPGPQQNYRPPMNPAPQQNYQYPQAGFASPAPYQAGPQGFAAPQPGFAPQQQQGFQGQGGWGQPGPGVGPGPGQQPYRPQPPQQFHNGGGPPQHFNGPQQPFTPPHGGGQTPYRPNAAPSPAPMGQNRPYQPQPMGHQQRPPRPPMHQGPTPPHHPPAKRPRFDGPGPGPSGPSNMGGPARPSLPVRPGSGSIPARPPSGPRSRLPTPPIARPPIHLGSGGPPPMFAPGGPRGSAGPPRGGMGGDRGRGRGGAVFNAPRGPSHMRREQQQQRDRSRRPEQSPAKKDKDRKDKKKDKDTAKTTMTDFRIVGIELKALGWTWGLVGNEAAEEAEDKAVKLENDEEQAETTEAPVTEDDTENKQVKPEAESTDAKADIVDNADTAAQSDEAVKQEASVTHDEADDKVGGKRKAHTPETDEGSAKKRSTYLLTHGKTNDQAAPENNQNRFRIYFESPPEADRVPQALRRNPYKRWRREDSAAPATAQDAKKGDSSLPEIAETSEGVASQGGAEENDKPGEADATVNEESVLDANEEPEDATVAETSGTAEETSVDPASTDAPVDTVESDDIEQGGASGTANGHGQLNAAVRVDDATAPAAESTDVPDESLAVSSDSVAPDVQATEATDAILSEFIAAHAEERTDEAILSESVDAEAVAEPTASVETTTAPGDDSTMPPPPSSDSIEPTLLSGEAEPTSEQDIASSVPQKATSEEDAAALAKSAENAASAYKTRTRRRSSVSSTDSRDTVHAFQPEVTPSLNRLSILYEGSQRRMCFDAEVVEKIKVFREEGRIEVLFLPVAAKEDEVVKDETENESEKLLPKGYLLEEYNQEEQRFAPVFRERLEELYASDDASDSVPPLHKHFSTPSNTGLALNVYLNKKNPLSLPRWCRTNTADEWLHEQFGSRAAGWRSKLEIVDPDPPPTLQSILEHWTSSSSFGTTSKRETFTSSLISEPYDLLEILLRLTKGDRSAPTLGHVPLATAIRSDSPYASHQTHVSLAILAMYRLTTDYAAKAGEKSEVVTEKIGDIIKSLPSGMITKSLDGMFKEWDAKSRNKDKEGR